MATHGTHAGDGVSAGGLDVLPVDLPSATRVSWALGSRFLDDAPRRLGAWQHVDAPWRVTLFHVDQRTVFVRLRSPVGHEHFYDATVERRERISHAFETAPEWVADAEHSQTRAEDT